MAVDISALTLAVELRAADGAEPLIEPMAGIMERLLDATSAMVTNYAENAPAAVQNEAVVRLAGFLYDAVPGRGVSDPLGFSGARAMLGPWRARRVYVLDAVDPAEDTALQQAIQAAIDAHAAHAAAHHEPGGIDPDTLAQSIDDALNRGPGTIIRWGRG